jgi:hypothetical protein
MLQSRQINEIYNLVEVSFAGFTLTSTTSGLNATQVVTFVLNSATGTVPATFLPGDVIELYPSAAVGSLGGLIISATPVAGSNGQLTIAIKNAAGATVTPSLGVWTCIAKRVAANNF